MNQAGGKVRQDQGLMGSLHVGLVGVLVGILCCVSPVVLVLIVLGSGVAMYAGLYWFTTWLYGATGSRGCRASIVTGMAATATNIRM